VTGGAAATGHRTNRSEHAALTTLAWTAAGAATAAPMLAVGAADDPLALSVVHLAGLVGFGVLLAFRLVRLTDEAWFGEVPARWRWWLTGGWAVVLVTGSVGLVALAPSAALRFDPSMQYLQVLSAVDIAWAATALAVGLRWWRGPRAAGIGVAVLAVVCIWSIWRYLDVVGFGPGGSWVVDAERMFTLVLPYDIAAAVMAITALWLGVRHRRG
jgi:hypothetical protein